MFTILKLKKNATLGDSADSGYKVVQSFHLKTISLNKTRQLKPDIGTSRGRHDIQINDTTHNDTHHNNTEHNELICDTQ